MTATRPHRRSYASVFAGGALVAAVSAAVLAASASAGGTQTGAVVACPLTASEVSAIVGRTVQRVNLSDDNSDPTLQCAFSASSRYGTKRLVAPQIFLTVDPGGAADLHDLYTYYVGVRSKLATRPRVATRPDLGAGAFTLTATTAPVTSAFFLLGKAGVGTLTVDLGGAPLALRDPDTADQVFALVHGRLH